MLPIIAMRFYLASPVHQPGQAMRAVTPAHLASPKDYRADSHACLPNMPPVVPTSRFQP